MLWAELCLHCQTVKFWSASNKRDIILERKPESKERYSTIPHRVLDFCVAKQLHETYVFLQPLGLTALSWEVSTSGIGCNSLLRLNSILRHFQSSRADYVCMYVLHKATHMRSNVQVKVSDVFLSHINLIPLLRFLALPPTPWQSPPQSCVHRSCLLLVLNCLQGTLCLGFHLHETFARHYAAGTAWHRRKDIIA